MAVAIDLDNACNNVQFKLLMDLLVQHGVGLTLTRREPSVVMQVVGN